jgi:hypothetical protein
MKRLRTLNSYQILKIKNKKYKTHSGWYPFQGLYNGTTLMQIQSGRTVPLTVHTFSQRLFFHLVVHQLHSHRHGHRYQHPLQHKQVQCTVHHAESSHYVQHGDR